jgi:hypothetical protein
VRYPGGRDALAKKIGTTGSSLSSRNSGTKPLGIQLARKIADETGVSVMELGAPEGLADPRGLTLLDRLEGLAVDLAEAARRVVELQERVSMLEARPWPGEDQPTGRDGDP